MLTLACLAYNAADYNELIWGTVIAIALMIVELILAPWVRLAVCVDRAIWLPDFLWRLLPGIVTAWV